jgi:Protein of unknown function (DUF2934)
MAEKKSPSKRTPRKQSPAPSADIPDPSISNEDVARRAYSLWEERGRPLGSPEEDWYKAKEELRFGA